MPENKIMTEFEFENWVNSMEAELEVFLSSLPRDELDNLDYSIDSLNSLESYILRNYRSISEMKTDRESHNRFSRYLGEVIRRNAGGEWDIELDDPEKVFFGIPSIKSPLYGRISPFTLITASIDRQTGNYLSKVATVHVNRANKA